MSSLGAGDSQYLLCGVGCRGVSEGASHCHSANGAPTRGANEHIYREDKLCAINTSIVTHSARMNFLKSCTIRADCGVPDEGIVSTKLQFYSNWMEPDDGQLQMTHLDLIMAVSAIKYFVAAGRLDFASSSIVRTTAQPPSNWTPPTASLLWIT